MINKYIYLGGTTI